MPSEYQDFYDVDIDTTQLILSDNEHDDNMEDENDVDVMGAIVEGLQFFHLYNSTAEIAKITVWSNWSGDNKYSTIESSTQSNLFDITMNVTLSIEGSNNLNSKPFEQGKGSVGLKHVVVQYDSQEPNIYKVEFHAPYDEGESVMSIIIDYMYIMSQKCGFEFICDPDITNQ